MWTRSRSALGVVVGVCGFLLFISGLIWGIVALIVMSEQREIRTDCQASGTMQTCVTRGDGRPAYLLETKQTRVIFASTMMVSGAVLLGAGLVAGRRQQFHYTPMVAASGGLVAPTSGPPTPDRPTIH